MIIFILFLIIITLLCYNFYEKPHERSPNEGAATH